MDFRPSRPGWAGAIVLAIAILVVYWEHAVRPVQHWPQAASPEEALQFATADERLDDMRELIAQGVNLDASLPTIMTARSAATALHLAADKGLVEPAELLIDAGAALNPLDDLQLTPLMCACSCGGRGGSAVAMLLINAGADVTVVRESDEMTALKFAAHECSAAVIQALIDKGADVDGPANTDQTALMLAARSNNLEAIKMLIKCGADPHRPCGLRWAKGRTAAWLAQNQNSKEAFEYLKDL